MLFFNDFDQRCELIRKRPRIFGEATPYCLIGMLSCIESIITSRYAQRGSILAWVHDDIPYFSLLRRQFFDGSAFSVEQTALAFGQLRTSVSNVLASMDKGLALWNGIHPGLAQFIRFNNENNSLFLYPIEKELFLMECLQFCFAVSRPILSVDFDKVFSSARENALFLLHGNNNVFTFADISESQRWNRLPIQDEFIVSQVNVIQERSMMLRSMICK